MLDSIRAIDALAITLGPLIRHLSESLGMHVSVFLGGPEPARRGQINMIRYVFGIYITR